jgi:hypothetical protein
MKKLRVYKGIVFDPAKEMWYSARSAHKSAASAVEWSYNGLSDDDHAALMDLKANPYEPAVTLEDVVKEALRSTRSVHLTVEEREMAIVGMIRTAFPHIDQEER